MLVGGESHDSQRGTLAQRLDQLDHELGRWRGAARSAEALAKAAAVETAGAWDGYRREAEQQRVQWQTEQEAAVVALTRQLADATRTVSEVGGLPVSVYERRQR